MIACAALAASSTARLRDELAWLRGRYDEGTVAPCVYTVIKTVEIELAWREHAKHQRLACERE
ncbi:MAG TPA: hypothetical protein VKG24_09850 [Pseudolabrys sp.]|nr:hypothetical protein [Pseudolabrys sp.]